MENKKFTLLNPSYGFLDENSEYKGFDLERAAFYTEETAASNGITLNVNGQYVDTFNNTFIATPYSDEQRNDIPFDIPDAKQGTLMNNIDFSGLDEPSNTL